MTRLHFWLTTTVTSNRIYLISEINFPKVYNYKDLLATLVLNLTTQVRQEVLLSSIRSRSDK